MKRSLFICVIFLTCLCVCLSACSAGDEVPEQPDLYAELSGLFPEEGYALGVRSATLSPSLIPEGYEAVHASYDRDGRIFALLVPEETPDMVRAVLFEGEDMVKLYDIPGEASGEWRVIHCDGGYTVVHDTALGKLHVLDGELFNIYDVDMWSSHIDSLVYSAALDRFFFTPDSSAVIMMSDTDFLEEEEVYAFEYPYSSPAFLSYSSDWGSIALSVAAGESDVRGYCSFDLDEFSASFEGVQD